MSFLPFTNWTYLNKIVKYYDQIILPSPVDPLFERNLEGFLSLNIFDNVDFFVSVIILLAFNFLRLYIRL